MKPTSGRPLLLDTSMFWNASGGVRRYVCAKRQWLASHTDWRHEVATPIVDNVALLKVPSMPLPGSGGAYRLPLRRAAAARLLIDAKPDVIEAADPYRLAWASLDAARALDVPCVAFCHSNFVQLAGQVAGAAAERAARRYAAHLYRHFDLVLAPSKAMVAHLHDWGVTALHQPLGVDTTVFTPDRCDAAWRASLGLPSSARLIVFAGRFAPEKNLQTLVDAVALLGEPYWLIAIGAGPMPPRGARVIVLPIVSDSTRLASMLASCDVFVHAGRQETFGLAALEAMACGLPVVAAACEGMTETVDATVGRGVTSAAAEEFAVAISDVFARGVDTLREPARQRALSYDWNKVLPMLWERYRAVISARSPPSTVPTNTSPSMPSTAPRPTQVPRAEPSTTP
jgi:alpha-1,6-mannosyltransferase